MGHFHLPSTMYYFIFLLPSIVLADTYGKVSHHENHDAGHVMSQDYIQSEDAGHDYSSHDYGHNSYSHSEHGHADHKCKKVKKVHWDTLCEPYVEKKCYTAVEQMCHDVALPKCKAVVDVVHDMKSASKHEHDCIPVKKSHCWDENKTVQESECCYSMAFKCPKPKHYGHGSHHEEHKCINKPTTDCSKKSKSFHEKRCKAEKSKECKDLHFVHPYSVKHKKCRSEPVKKCHVKTQTRPVKVKKFSYKKVCKPMPRKVCEKVEKEVLRPVCGEVVGQKCQYKPKKHCNEEHKKHCYKVEKVSYEKVCDHKH